MSGNGFPDNLPDEPVEFLVGVETPLNEPRIAPVKAGVIKVTLHRGNQRRRMNLVPIQTDARALRFLRRRDHQRIDPRQFLPGKATHQFGHRQAGRQHMDSPGILPVQFRHDGIDCFLETAIAAS